MMEKQNRMQEKQARGDSGALDDIVEAGARDFARRRSAGHVAMGRMRDRTPEAAQ